MSIKTKIRIPVLLALLLAAAPLRAQRLPALIPYAADSLWGYSDRQGHVRIPAQWAEAGFFKGRRAQVQVTPAGGWYALIDAEGRYILPPELHWTGDRSSAESARFNISDGKGHWGLADTNGRLLIAPRFDRSEQQFTYSPAWGQPVLVAGLEGKTGIIDGAGRTLVPFEYDWLQPIFEPADPESRAAQRFAPRFCRLILAGKGGKTGVIDKDNRTVIPFGRYEQLALEKPFWFRYGSASGGYGILDSTGKIVVPAGQYSGVRPAGTDYFIVSNNIERESPLGLPLSQMALVDRSGETVLPFRFWILYAYADSLIIYHRDSSLPANYSGEESNDLAWQYEGSTDSAVLQRHRDWLSSTLNWSYDRSFALPGLRPLRDWSLKVWPIRTEPSCGTSSRYQALGERVLVGGRWDRFEKDSIGWSAEAIIGPGLYTVRGYDRSDARARRRGDKRELTAVVSDSLTYVVGPLPGRADIFSVNPKDRLFVAMQTRYEQGRDHTDYALLDFRQQVLIPYQKTQMMNAFRWGKKLYTTVPYGNMQFSRGYSHFTSNGLRLADAAAVPIPSLAQYRLLQSLPGGPASGQPAGSFLAADTGGRQGFVNVEGVVLPAISFKKALLIPVGDGLFLSGDSRGDYALIDEAGREPVAGLRVSSADPATAHKFYEDYSFAYGTTVPGLYEVRTDGRAGWPRQFYVGANGVTFARRPDR